MTQTRVPSATTAILQRWLEWQQQDEHAFFTLKRAASRLALRHVFDGTHDADMNVVSDLVNAVHPYPGEGSPYVGPAAAGGGDDQTPVFEADEIHLPKVQRRGRKRRRAGTPRYVQASLDDRDTPPADWMPHRKLLTAGQPTKVWTPPAPKHNVVTTNPPHPLQQVRSSPVPAGYFVAIRPEVAAQIAAWWVGRPSTEWSARAVIHGAYYGKPDEQGRFPWRGIITRIFRNDDLHPDANGTIHRDSGGGTTMLAEWEAGIIQQLLQEGKPKDLEGLRCHIHSHNSMGAFWSTTDERMRGACLDEQAAIGSVQSGWHCSLVIGNSLALRCALDGWQRKPDGTMDYWIYDQVPVKVKWEGVAVPLQEVLDVRKSLSATPVAYAGRPAQGASVVGAGVGHLGAEDRWPNYHGGAHDYDFTE